MKDKELVKKLQVGHGEWADEMTVVSINLLKYKMEIMLQYSRH